MTVGKVIAKLRKDNKVTQAELGQAMHVSSQAISKWENDSSCPDINMISKLAEYFDVEISIFFPNSKKEVKEDVKELIEIKETNEDTTEVSFEEIESLLESYRKESKPKLISLLVYSIAFGVVCFILLINIFHYENTHILHKIFELIFIPLITSSIVFHSSFDSIIKKANKRILPIKNFKFKIEDSAICSILNALVCPITYLTYFILKICLWLFSLFVLPYSLMTYYKEDAK